MSSSAPEGSRRNSMCHTAARTSPMTTTRRANLGVPKNSRIVKRYAMPASAREPMKYGPPLSPKLRAQIVSATHNVAPSMYTLHAGVIFTISILPCPSGTCRHKLPLPAPARTRSMSEMAIFRQLILGVPVMRTEPALPSCRRSCQSPAFGATIKENFASALVENASRRSFNEGFISCVSETQYVRIIGEGTGKNYGFTRLSLGLSIASAPCGLYCRPQVHLCSPLNRSHEMVVPADDIVSDGEFAFHRSTKCVAPQL